MKRAVLIACAVLACTSCGGQKNKKSTVPEGRYTADSILIYEPVVEFPPVITDPEGQIRWIAEHYWDKFDFADTLSVARWSDYAEQAFVDMNAVVVRNVPPEIATEFITALFRKAAVNKDVFLKFAEIAEKYLIDPNYPLRSEEMYIAVLNAMLANPALDEWERIRPQEQLRMALKNRPGDLAADFRYTLANGATGTLHTLKAPYTMLFLNNPGCPACRELMDQIGASAFLQNQIEKGALKVLAVYPDEDVAALREYLPNMPAGWIVSYDATLTIENEALYDLKAIPTIYLLDAGKRVMLKDEMSIPLIEQTIYNSEAATAAAN